MPYLRSLFLKTACLALLFTGVLTTTAICVSNASGFAPCPGIVRFPIGKTIDFSGSLTAGAGGVLSPCQFSHWEQDDTATFDFEESAVITNNCNTLASETIPLTVAEKDLSISCATAYGRSAFQGVDPELEAEGIQGTTMIVTMSYTVDLEAVVAANSGCLPGALARFCTDALDPLTIVFPFEVLQIGAFDAAITLTVDVGAGEDDCGDSFATATWMVDKDGGPYHRENSVEVDGVGLDVGVTRHGISPGDYILTVELEHDALAKVCLEADPTIFEEDCTYTVTLDVELEFDDCLFCF